jgi:pimeloyl-ACP methyl ester carboxylesterase
MNQRLKALLAALLLGPTAAFAQRAASLTGDWRGSLGGLTFTAHLQDPAAGPRTATLDIPAQHAQGLPLTFTQRADSVYLDLPLAHARFAGRLAADGQTLAGEWHQGSQSLPLTFGRVKADGSVAGPRRPQTPHAPFPYQSQDVTFRNEAAGVTLAGTLTRPLGRGAFPAVVLLTGSGPEDRDETLFDHKPFAVLADYLTRRGVAVLRFDDRGVGQSTGTLQGTTSADYAADARAALAWLRARPDITKKHVGLLGHSQGGTAAMLAAGQPQGPDFVVLLAAPGLPGEELLVQQVVALNRLHTSDSTALAIIEQRQRTILAAITQHPDNAQARASLLPLLAAAGSSGPAAERTAAQMTSPSYRALLADRPAQALAHVQCPVLALNGSKDAQVVAAPNLAGIRQGLQAAGNRDVTTQELPSLNHLFQTARTGAISEYAMLEETCAPTLLQAVGNWVVSHSK